MTGQINLNRYQLDKALKKYHENMCKYIRMKDEIDSLSAVASTAQYGIEATLPKAVGGNSDPVFAHIQIKESRIFRFNKIKEELLLIQKLTEKISGDTELEVHYWLLEGMSFRWIGAKLNMSHTTIHRVRERILDMMLK